jgi:hypothetical protein
MNQKYLLAAIIAVAIILSIATISNVYASGGGLKVIVHVNTVTTSV